MLYERSRTRTIAPLVMLALLALVIGPAISAGEPDQSKGQVLYVPVYTQVLYGERKLKLNLALMLSVRNTDPARSITIEAVEYHGSNGKLVRSFLEKPQRLGPLATTEFHVGERDQSGGTSASFIVRWKSDAPAAPALVEAVMISTAGTQGISFKTQARVIDEIGE